MSGLRELSHTADVGFEATAATPEELFEVAADGLVGALGLEAAAGDEPAAGEQPATGEEARRAAGSREVEISSPDAERLLVHWLRDLLADVTSGLGVPEARVREVRLAGEEPASLRASVRWRPASSAGPEREIKGITYHGLRIERTEDGVWHARVVLDV